MKASDTMLICVFRPVGSGKTALLLALCRAFRDDYNIGESHTGQSDSIHRQSPLGKTYCIDLLAPSQPP